MCEFQVDWQLTDFTYRCIILSPTLRLVLCTTKSQLLQGSQRLPDRNVKRRRQWVSKVFGNPSYEHFVAGPTVLNSLSDHLYGIQLLTPNNLGVTSRRIRLLDIRSASALEVFTLYVTAQYKSTFTYLLTYLFTCTEGRCGVSAILQTS